MPLIARSLLLAVAALGLAACSDAPEAPVEAPARTAAAPADAAPDVGKVTPAAPPPAPPEGIVGASGPVVDAEMREALDWILAHPMRVPANKARDVYRHPKETLEFFGLQSRMTVIEITPGAGWYSEILAPVLKTRGNYVAAVWDPQVPDQPAYRAPLTKRLTQRFNSQPKHFSRAEVRRFDPRAPRFGPPASADMVLSFRNAHNWIEEGTAPAYFQAFADVLKSGGVLGIVDHRAPEGAATDGKSGYVTQEQIIELAIGAGFVLAEESEINANPKDTRDHPEGVWTLPPTLALGATDREKYLAIGESDRMTLKFLKP
jgi:predicted methyltransferase